MKEYFLSVIAVAALGSIGCSICPEGEGGKIKKAFSLIMALLLIFSVGEPIMRIAEGIRFSDDSIISGLYVDEKKNYEAVWENTVRNLTKAELEKAVCEMLTEKYSLENRTFNVDCRIESNENGYRIEKIHVKLSGNGIFLNPRAIEEHLQELFQCTVEADIEWSDKN